MYGVGRARDPGSHTSIALYITFVSQTNREMVIFPGLTRDYRGKQTLTGRESSEYP